MATDIQFNLDGIAAHLSTTAADGRFERLNCSLAQLSLLAADHVFVDAPKQTALIALLMDAWKFYLPDEQDITREAVRISCEIDDELGIDNSDMWKATEGYEIIARCARLEIVWRPDTAKQKFIDFFHVLRAPEIRCNRAARHSTWIYLFHDSATGLYKIGRSNHPDKRLAQIRSQPTLLPVEFKYSLVCAWEGSPDDETALHERFAPHRVRGEWFNLNRAQLAEIRRFFQRRREWVSPLKVSAV